MGSFIKDLRFAFRLIYKDLRFSVMVLLIVSLGSASICAVFSLMDAMLIRPLARHISNGDRIVVVWETDLNKGATELSSSAPNFIDYQKNARSFEQMAASIDTHFTMTGEAYPERIWGAYASTNYFTILGVSPMMGRSYLPNEDQAGRDQVLIISHRLWENRFGADPNIIGKKILIDGLGHEVIGVTPKGFAFPPGNLNVEIWKPIVFTEQMLTNRGMHTLDIYGLLKPGVTASGANAELNVIARNLEKQYPATNAGIGASVVTLRDQMGKPAKLILWILLGAVCFVQLLVCANISNFLLVRSLARRKEFAIRIAVGVGKWRLARQLLTESLVLALIGSVGGILLGIWAVRGLVVITPDWVLNSHPRLADMGLNWGMASVTILATLIVGVVCGMAPAIYSAKSDVNILLKESGKADSSYRVRRLGNLLIVAEVAVTLILLVGAGLMAKSFVRLFTMDPGFDPKNAITMKVSLPDAKYKGKAQIAGFYQNLLEQIKGLPQVKSVGASSLVPLESGTSRTGFKVESGSGQPLTVPTMVNYRVVSPDYFTTMRTPLLAGRSFTELDLDVSQPTVIINEVLARRFFPNEDPLGKRVGIARENTVRDIVGIVKDTKQSGLSRETAPEVYVPMAQSPRLDMTLVVRSNSDPKEIISSIRGLLRNIDSNQPVFNINYLEQVVAESIYPQRFFMSILGSLAILASIFSALGLYTIISYGAAQRSREIGIRMAMGAESGDVLKMVLRQGVWPVVVGCAVGVSGAYFLSNIISSFLYEVKATDVITFASTSILVIMVSFIATLVPAMRAAKLDPAVVLRHE